MSNVQGGNSTGPNSVETRGQGGAGADPQRQVVAALTPVISATVIVTRPANTTAYTAGDNWSSSTSAPATIDFANVVNAAGNSMLITDLVVVDLANQTVLLQGELWLFNAAPTQVNDNSAFTLSNADIEKAIGIIPFTMGDTGSSAAGASGNTINHVQNLSIGYTSILDANLYAMVKVLNAYTPVSAESLVFMIKCAQVG